MSTTILSRKRKPNPPKANASKRGKRAKVPPYKSPALSADKRVKDLLARMTLEEKAAQMTCVWQQKANKLVDENGNFDAAKAQEHLWQGSWPRPGRPAQRRRRRPQCASTAELTNAIQKFFIEESRLGIPVIFHEECLHGQAAPDSHQLFAADRPGGDV